MKHTTRLLIFCLCLLGLPALAAPILQSGWTTTTSAATARGALGAAPTNLPHFYNPSYTGNLLSTNAYPLIWATVNAASSGQNLLEGYTGDTAASSWKFRVSHATNNFNPAVNDASPFSSINDVQLHYGYNIITSSALLPQWVRGHEITWFNPFRAPVMEFYDRVTLTNGILSGQGVGFGYDVGLETGWVDADLSFDTLGFRHPKSLGVEWMTFTSNTNNVSGILSIVQGYLDFQTGNTNRWLVQKGGVGLLGYTNSAGAGTLYLNQGNTGLDTVTLFRDANTTAGGADLLTLNFGGINSRGIRYQQTNSNQRFEYQDPDGAWHAFNEDVSSAFRRTYDIPNNTAIGITAGNYRTLGVLTNSTGEDLNTTTVQIDIIFTYEGLDSTAQRYVIPGNQDDVTHTSWEECLPIHESGRGGTKHYAVDTRYNAGQKEFRARRLVTGVNDNGNFKATVTTYGRMVWTTDASGSGAGATVVGYSRNTPIIQTAGKVGINTNNPQAALHVAGNAIFDGTITANAFEFTSGSFGTLVATNFFINSNSPPATPTHYGQKYFWNSNGQALYVLNGNINALTWATTNVVVLAYDANQFGFSGGQLRIKGAAIVTNLNAYGVTTIADAVSGENILLQMVDGTGGPTLIIDSGSDPFNTPVSISTTGIVATAFYGNGNGLTNLDLTIQTNVTVTGVIPVGKTTYSNITANIVIGGFSGVDLNGEDWANIYVTNGSGAGTPRSVTFAASVLPSTNTFVLDRAVWVTNAVYIGLKLAAWGTNMTVARMSP